MHEKFTIPSWEKWQEREGRPNYIWFKMSGDFFEDPRIFRLTPLEKVMFIYCLCLVNKTNGGAAVFDTEQASYRLRARKEAVGLAFLAVRDAGLVEMENAANCAIEKSREEKNIYTADLEQAYQLYPKRPNSEKKRGMQKLAREIKTPEAFEKLMTAIVHYAKYCKGKDPKYIKQFATFAGCWEEWVAPPSLASAAPKMEMLK